MAKHRTGHLFKRGKNFYVRWAVNGKVFSKALRDSSGGPITTERDAEEAKTRVMATFLVADEATALESIVAKLDGRRAELTRLQDENNPALTIAQAWQEFLRSANRPDSGDATLRQYGFQWSAFADWMKKKHPGVLALREVGKPIAEDYAAKLTQDKLSSSTYNKHLNLLALVFKVLKSKAKVETNPWNDIQRKRLIPYSRRELTVEELKKLCTSATGELQILLAVGVYSGLRLGDCATLRWAEVDLPRSLIRRIPNKTARRNPKPVIVPIHPVLASMLAETPSEKRGEYVLPETAALYSDRVDRVTDMIQGHFKKCGIQTHKKGTGGVNGKRAVVEVGFHSLRHTFVSLCRESNAPLAVVESIVGHSNPAMTRHYTHVGELAAGKAVAALPTITDEVGPLKKDRNEQSPMARAYQVLRRMTHANWKVKRAELMQILSPEANSLAA